MVTNNRLILLALLISSDIFAADFCALKAKILDDRGNPIMRTVIELVDPTGAIVLRKSTASELEICDFGFGLHTLRIGPNEDYPVSISNLEALPEYPIALTITLTRPGRYIKGTNYCEVYFRVVDEKSQPVAEATVGYAGITSAADSYGRWFDRLIRQQPRQFVIRKAGFIEALEDATCHASERIERTVVLKRITN